MGFLFGLGFLQGSKLSLGEDDAILGHFGFQGLQPLHHRGAATRSGRRRATHGEPALSEFIGDADLPESRLFDGKRHDGGLDLFGDAVLEHRLLS